MREIRVELTTDKELIRQFRDMIEEITQTPVTEPKIHTKSILTREEAAQLLSVSLVTLFHWNNKGILKSRRIGGQVRYYRSDIEAILEGREVENE